MVSQKAFTGKPYDSLGNPLLILYSFFSECQSLSDLHILQLYLYSIVQNNKGPHDAPMI